MTWKDSASVILDFLQVFVDLSLGFIEVILGDSKLQVHVRNRDQLHVLALGLHGEELTGNLNLLMVVLDTLEQLALGEGEPLIKTLLLSDCDILIYLLLDVDVLLPLIRSFECWVYVLRYDDISKRYGRDAEGLLSQVVKKELGQLVLEVPAAGLYNGRCKINYISIRRNYFDQRILAGDFGSIRAN